MASKKKPKQLTLEEQKKKDLAEARGRNRADALSQGISGLPGAGRGRILSPDKKTYNRKKDKMKWDKEATLSPASISVGDVLPLHDGDFVVRFASANMIHVDGPYEEMLMSLGGTPYSWAERLEARLRR